MEKSRGQRMPAVALTALASREDRLQALKADFQAHVTKPVKLAELVVVIASIMRLYPRKQS
jgi:CheY-like chemotaxis protein